MAFIRSVPQCCSKQFDRIISQQASIGCRLMVLGRPRLLTLADDPVNVADIDDVAHKNFLLHLLQQASGRAQQSSCRSICQTPNEVLRGAQGGFPFSLVRRLLAGMMDMDRHKVGMRAHDLLKDSRSVRLW